VSNSTSCISSGNEVLIDSNNKQIIIGSYSTGGGSAVLDIDTVYTSSSTEGYFIGRYDDDALNSCCKAELEIGKSLVICEGDAWPVLDITGQIPDFTSIQWFLNGAPFPQPSNAQSISTFAAGTYSVVVEYGNGCTATDAMTLVVEDCEPDCDITPKLTVKTKYCSASFGNNSYATGGSSIIGYLWDFGDGSTSTEVNPMHTYQVGGSYIVTLTVYGLDEEGNCCTKQIQTKVIINYSCKPECKLKSGFNLTAVGNGVFLFESNASTNGFTTIIGYEWTINGTVVSNNPYFAQPFTNGIVCLTVYGLTSGGECCSDSVCRSYKGKEEGTLEKNIKVFPNPTKNRVNLDFDKEDANTIKNIRVVDLTGRSIYTGKTNDQKFQIDSKQWPVGMYLITIEIDGVSTTAKIVKN
jgi:PKD repeat protein